jgi:acylphosphatase
MSSPGSDEAQSLRHVIIRGRVQGVGFRAWTEMKAHELGLAGWVRNRRDGTVEAMFAGDAAAVAAMVEACRRGPPGGQVVDAADRPGTAEELKLRRPGETFSVLPTA